MPNEPKLHHFLPEAYLRRFADERSDLWVLDRKQVLHDVARVSISPVLVAKPLLSGALKTVSRCTRPPVRPSAGSPFVKFLRRIC